jgi:hypothetical protein
MTGELSKLAAFWSPKTAIFTKLGVLVQLAYVVASLPPMTILFIGIGFINWWWVGVLILVVLSVILSFSGKKNLGFVIAIVSILVHLIQAAVNGSWSIFTVVWDVVFFGELLFHNYLFVASLLFLPLSTILLVVGRPEWKLLKRKN